MKERNYWTLENTLDEYRKVANGLGHAATAQELKKLDKSGLVQAINKQGGIHKIRKLSGYDCSKKPKRYWTLYKTVKEYKKIVDKLGHPVTGQELMKLKKNDILGAINKYGGLSKIKTECNILESTMKEYKKISDNLGHPATYKELQKLEKSDLIKAIIKYGGIKKIMKNSGYK